jgi:hypothetical protein
LPLAEAEPSGSPMGLMALAIQGKADVAVLERLEAMQERFDKRKAKKDYDEALAAFQAECPVILKSVDGAQRKYRFAPMDHILQIVQPILKKHGFSWSVTTQTREGWVKCIVTIKHASGHSENSEFETPIDSRNNLMNAAQAYGGARTFCLRYAFTGGFGIVTADEDRDGQTARSKLPTWLAERMDAQAALPAPAPTPAARPQPTPAKTRLWNACQPIRGTAGTWDIAETWMQSKKILKPGQKVSTLTEDEMTDARVKVEIELT